MRTTAEHAELVSLPVLGGMEVLRARYVDHEFAPHSHDTFVIGIFERGAAEIHCEGETFTAGEGSVLTINPGAVHRANSRHGEWQYRAFYPDAGALASLLGEEQGMAGTLDFARPWRQDPSLASIICAALARMEGPGELLHREEALVRMVQGLWNPASRCKEGPRRQVSAAVLRAREFIEANARRPITLGEIAAAAGLSRFHLVRCFSAAFGLSPYAYFLQCRIRAAKALLAAGLAPSSVSSQCGFADQSHLTRQFKRVVGVTPGEYAAGRWIRSALETRH